MSVPTTIRLFTCAVMLALLPVYGAQSGNACGQSTYSDLTGTITSPNYPNNYQNYQTCNYYIDAPSLSTINFTFSGLGLQQSTACVYDWIEFTCESNPISQPIRFCGFGYREELSFKPCSRVLLRFASYGSATFIGFSVSYEIEPIRCQGDCTPVTSGSSYSCPCDAYRPPFIPSPYDQCDYGCYSNSIYCACSFPPTKVYSTPQSSTTRTTILHSACGQGTYSSLSGNITSLNYPNNYQNYQTCNYYIDALSLSTINFTFNGLSLEQSTACVYDWIEITCESNSISQPIRYCGFGYREELSFKPCSRVLVTFVSDGSVTNIGFSVSYDIEPIRCQGDCTPVSNGDSYYCPCDANQTPFIPPPYYQCPYGCFRSSRYCACSYPPTNVDLNSSTSPPAIRTTPNFISTNSPDCGQSTYSDLTGSITSLNYPNYYQNNQNCNYYIDAPSLSTITFTFNGLGLEQTYPRTCFGNWIEFTCESNSISRPIRHCGFGYRPQLSFKPCSRVRLSFVSGGSVANTGFSVSYEIEPIRCQGDCSPVLNGPTYSCPCDANQNPFIPPPYDQCPYYCYRFTPCTCSFSPNNPPSSTTDSYLACGQSTYNNLTGNITSTNYPNYYQNNQNCNYYLDAPSLSSINFTFNGLGLEQSDNCYYDWIEFTCESNSISQPIRYCGFGYRPELSFKPCSRVLLRFMTDGSVTNIGFSVSYEIEPIRCQGGCTPVANGTSYYCPCDTNQTPFIPPPYDQCPNGCYSNSPYCACSYPPTNVDSNSSTSLPTIRSTPHFIPTDSPVLRSDCGQSTYSNLTGSITSPNYPNYYQNNQNCIYYIDAPSLSTINFTFNALALERSPTCYYDLIEFTCVSNSISQPIRFCGFGYRPELSFKPCSRVRLWFYSDISATNIGFSVSYEIEPIRCQGNCAPVSDGASYNCPCDANQTPFVPQPYDQCLYGCYSSLNPTYCACSYPNFNSDSNSSTSPPFSTDSYLEQSFCTNNPCLFGYCANGNEAIGGYCLCWPGYTGQFCTVVIDDNSSGNVSPSATTRPSLVTPTTRSATVNVANSSGYVSQFATTRPTLVPPSSRPATVNVGNSSGIVFQSTTTRPSNVNTRTTPRPVTPNEGNRSLSSPHVPRQ